MGQVSRNDMRPPVQETPQLWNMGSVAPPGFSAAQGGTSGGAQERHRFAKPGNLFKASFSMYP